MAAAIGAGLPVGEPTGNMIVDIGGGTSEVAVISLGGIVVSQSVRVGGDELDEAIINYVKKEYKLLIGQQTAEEVKLEIGSAYPLDEEVQAEIRGRDLVSGLPKTVVLTSEEVRAALEEPLVQIIDAIKETLDRTPPELASDIMDRGIMLAGGGSLLQGLDERLREETQMPAHRAESPLTCVAVGSGPLAGGVRGDPPLEPQSQQQPASAQAMMHDKVVRRRRAVLAVLVLLSLFLLTAYFGEGNGGAPARRPARRDGGLRADPGGRQPGAQAVPRPVRLVRRHARRQGREQEAQGPERAAAEGPRRRRGGEARARAVQGPAGAERAGRARRLQPGPGARDRPLAELLVPDVPDQQGLQRRRPDRPAGHQRRRPRRQGQVGLRRQRRR